MQNKRFIRLTIFYLLAILSNIFRKGLFGINDLLKGLPEWQYPFTFPLQAIGILLGALVALHLMNKEKTAQYSFFGTSKSYSILIATIPIILIIVFGVQNKSGINHHLFGSLAAISVLLYCFFEEMGWRGYLHDEMQGIKQWQRVLIIGFLWWFWHLEFIGNHDLLSNLTFLTLLTASAWGLGILIEHTKSVLAVSAFHMVVNVLFLNPYLQEGMLLNKILIITAVSVTIWIVLLIFWNKRLLWKRI